MARNAYHESLTSLLNADKIIKLPLDYHWSFKLPRFDDRTHKIESTCREDILQGDEVVGI